MSSSRIWADSRRCANQQVSYQPYTTRASVFYNNRRQNYGEKYEKGNFSVKFPLKSANQWKPAITSKRLVFNLRFVILLNTYLIVFMNIHFLCLKWLDWMIDEI